MRDLKGLWRFPGDFLRTFSNGMVQPCDSCQLYWEARSVTRWPTPMIQNDSGLSQGPTGPSVLG